MAIKNNTLILSWSVLVGGKREAANKGVPSDWKWSVSQSWFRFLTLWQQMLFFDDDKAGRPTGEGCDGVLISDNANEEEALRLHKAPVLSWPSGRSVFSLVLGSHQQVWTGALVPSGEIPRGCGRSWCVWVKTHLSSLCSHGSLFSAFETDGHLCPSMGRRNNLSCVTAHRQIVVQNHMGMDHQISCVLSPAWGAFCLITSMRAYSDV